MDPQFISETKPEGPVRSGAAVPASSCRPSASTSIAGVLLHCREPQRRDPDPLLAATRHDARNALGGTRPAQPPRPLRSCAKPPDFHAPMCYVLSRTAAVLRLSGRTTKGGASLSRFWGRSGVAGDGACATAPRDAADRRALATMKDPDFLMESARQKLINPGQRREDRRAAQADLRKPQGRARPRGGAVGAKLDIGLGPNAR